MDEKKACLRQFIRNASMTNIAFAERIGMNPSSFQTMMNRHSPLKVDVYDKIVSAMAEIIVESDLHDFPNTAQLLNFFAEFLGCEVGEIPSQIFSKAGDFCTPFLLAMRWNEENLEIRERMNTAFDRMNKEGQEVAAKRVEELAEIPRYQKENSSDKN